MNAPNNNDGGRKRSRKRGSGRGKKSDGGSATNKKRNRNKAPKIDLDEFWGDATQLPSSGERVTSTPDITAVVSSLGRPPVPGQETPAEHWFSLVYERAAVLAGALAAAGGIEAHTSEPGSEASNK